MDILPEYKKKPIRSYVIRSGRITEGQKAAFRDFWPVYGLSLHDGRLDMAKAFPRIQPLVVEVGFGMGDSLLAMAQAEPNRNFVGIEVHSPGVGRLLTGAASAKLENLRIYMADAVDVLEDCFEDSSISRFQLYFPDPWHKKKHHKRRIVQAPFVALVSRKLMSGGTLHFATDWEHYAQQMLDVLQASPLLENTAGRGCFSPKPAYRPATKFEKRGENLGHGVWDLLFSRL